MMKPVSDDVFLKTMRDDFNASMLMLPESVTQEYHVKVADMDGFALLADLYYKEKRPAQARPALIYMHDWASGRQPAICAERQSAYLALKANYLCMPLYYRQPSDAIFPAALHDLKCGIRWLRSRADELGIDPDKVIVMGSSAGTQWTGLAAATNGAPEYEGEGGFHGFSSDVDLAVMKSAIYSALDFPPGRIMDTILGSTREEKPDLYKEASPLHRVHRGMPPMLMIHGDQDESCPVASATEMHKKLQDAGVPSELVVLKGRGHGLSPEDFIWHLDKVIAFAETHLD